MLSGRILGEHTHIVDEHLKVMKVEPRKIVGQHPSTLGVRERSGVSIVAVERGDDVVIRFPDEFRFQPDDRVYICGSDESLRRFRQEYE